MKLSELHHHFLPLLGTFLLACSPPLWAQPATISGNLVTVPAVNSGDESQNMVLEVQVGTDPLQLRIAERNTVNGDDFRNPAVLSGNQLRIPEVLLGGVRYEVELRLLTPEMLVVESVAVVAEIDSSVACQRPEPDRSHGPNDAQLNAQGILVPPDEIFDGGAGFDGIPAIDNPVYGHPTQQALILPSDRVIGVKIGNQVRAYPHYIMDYHEIVNDGFLVDGTRELFSLNYCPLTGSAMMWKGDMAQSDPSFGVSGLLYNSNLVLYDRETSSFWSQMLEQAISGPMAMSIPERVQVIETTWETWLEMYPDSRVLTTNTGFSQDYRATPYGGYGSSSRVLFPVANPDNRLHPKARVVGINVGDASKVYPINSFSAGITALNDRVGNMDVVVVGSGGKDLGAIFNRQLEDCTMLEFSPLQDQLPNVMTDNESNVWDVFGNAVSGPRTGAALEKTNSYIAYWFAWSAFFPGAEIYQ